LIEVRRPRENVGRMPLLWNFHHGGVLQLLSREFGICGRFFGVRWPLTLRIILTFGVLPADGGRA
jgi:hypothetical protein